MYQYIDIYLMYIYIYILNVHIMYNYIVDVHGLYISTYHSAGPPFSRFKQLRPTPGMVKLISEIVRGALGEASTLLAG